MNTASELDDTIRVIMSEKAAEIPPPAAPEPERMVVMRLERNYRPVARNAEIVGHMREETRRKGPDGRDHVIPEQWIPNEMTPAPRPGAGTPGKIWAGTVIRLPMSEAKTIERLKIGVPTIAD